MRAPALAGWALCLAACMSTARWDAQESWAGRDLGTFPYHPLVYHLDLSILAYQLHSQTLVWPFDPYYAALGRKRGAFEEKVRAWVRTQPPGSGLASFRGPGALAGFPDNPNHDPILFRYGAIHPWSASIANPGSGKWVELRTPEAITGRIARAFVCYRPAGAPEDAVTLDPVPPGGDDRGPGAADVLLAFEGGTGDKGDPGQPPSQSLMGFVLLRTRPDGRYDVHVAFRGSRSGGSVLRTVFAANWDPEGPLGRDASGNPDWITDLGYRKVAFPLVSTVGKVHRGFAHSMATILPKVVRCLAEVARMRRGEPPVSIYVTGHSLGGGLAQHFASAVLQGDRYGPAGAGPAMPAPLRSWPWHALKLVTYSAPRAGDEAFARALTVDRLQSDLFTSAFRVLDRDALPPADAGVVARLVDPSRPAGFRVLDTRDPVTTEKIVGGKHVGKSVYVNRPRVGLRGGAHRPSTLREAMLEAIADPRTPAGPVWHEPDEEELFPSGGRMGLRDLADAVARYYTDRGIWFDHTAYAGAVELRFAIEDQGCAAASSSR